MLGFSRQNVIMEAATAAWILYMGWTQGAIMLPFRPEIPITNYVLEY